MVAVWQAYRPAIEGTTRLWLLRGPLNRLLEATIPADALMPQCGGCVAGCQASHNDPNSLVVAAWAAESALEGHHSLHPHA